MVCVIGLGTSPYLDLTFHRARQATSPAGGKAAFGLGFGTLFLAMIAFSLAYSGWLAADRPVLPALIAAILLTHFIIQCGLTIGLHAIEVRGAAAEWNWPAEWKWRAAWKWQAPLKWVARSKWLALWKWMAPLLAVCVAGLFGDDWHYAGHTGGEVIYRCFLAFYGLIAPAYVWTCMLPARRNHRALAIALIVATPMYWMAFVEGHMIWLAGGVAAVVACGEWARNAKAA
jgi:hypothetical protein